MRWPIARWTHALDLAETPSDSIEKASTRRSDEPQLTMPARDMDSQIWKKHAGEIVPALLLLALLGCVALGIENRTSRAIAPPIYDPLGYIHKGHAVWKLVGEGRIGGLLNAEPSLRPPGCVPFTQPFGYAADFRSFLFWSTFSPIAIWLVTLWLLLGPMTRTIADRWNALALCGGLISLPLFYHFEVNKEVDKTWVGQWGLQDNLLATLAALATCLLVQGAARRSAPITVAGWLVAAYTLLVKPAGALIMLLMFGVWAVEILVTPDPKRDRVKGRGRRYYPQISVISCATIYVSTLGACLSSDYLSSANLTAGVTAQKIVRSLYDTPSAIWLIFSYMRPVIGWFWLPVLLVLFAGGLVHSAARFLRGSFGGAHLRTAAALLVVIVGGLWWICLAGLEARYFYPFILIPLVWLLPQAFALLPALDSPLRMALGAISLTPTVALALLLWSGNPSVVIQEVMGVNLSSGGYRREVQIAEHLMALAKARKRALVIYAQAGYREGVVHAVDSLAAVSSGDEAMLSWVWPLDWARPPGVRISDLMRAEYILYEKSEGENSRQRIAKVETFAQELVAFNGWLATLSLDDGVSQEFDGPLSVLKITDSGRLLKSFRSYVSRRVWRDSFIANNPELFGIGGPAERTSH
jgi:hypothetical protein